MSAPGERAGSAPVRSGAWLVVAASLAFATSSPLSRLARPAHPIAIACARVALAGVVLSLLDLRGAARSLLRLTGRERARVALAGLLLAGHFGLFQWGLDETSLPAAVALVSLEPLSVVLAAWGFFGIVPRRLEKIGVLVATAGAIVISRGAGQGEHRAFGDLLVLGAVVLFGLYVVSARGLREALPSMHYAALVYVAAGITLAVILPFAPTRPDAMLWPVPAGSVLAIAALVLVPTVIGHTLVQVGARTLSPSLVALVCPGETLGSIAIAMVLWRKPPTMIEVIGGAVILAGSAIAVRGQRDAN